jgi:hypothetical protein
MGRMATVAVAAVAMAMSLAGATSAGAEPLDLSVAHGASAGQPLAVTASGVAGVARRLYLYAEAGSFCGGTPQKEVTKVPTAVALTGAEGAALEAGSFTRTYQYTPTSDGDYSLCGYLDDSPEGLPAAYTGIGFIVPEGPVPTPPFSEAVLEELQQFAREAQESEALKLAREREQRESENSFWLSSIASEVARSETPSAPSRSAPAIERCVVPVLRGRSLAAARRLLRRAHCALGAVRRARARRGSEVVTAQRVRRGTVLAAGSPVSVVVGLPRR